MSGGIYSREETICGKIDTIILTFSGHRHNQAWNGILIDVSGCALVGDLSQTVLVESRESYSDKRANLRYVGELGVKFQMRLWKKIDPIVLTFSGRRHNQAWNGILVDGIVRWGRRADQAFNHVYVAGTRDCWYWGRICKEIKGFTGYCFYEIEKLFKFYQKVATELSINSILRLLGQIFEDVFFWKNA